MSSHKAAHTQISETCEYVMLHGREEDFADVIKVADLADLKMENYPGGSNLITRGL